MQLQKLKFCYLKCLFMPRKSDFSKALVLVPCKVPETHGQLVTLYINSSLNVYLNVSTKVWYIDTVRCNQIGPVFAEMSSRTALTRHIGMRITFWTKYIKASMLRFVLWWFQFFITLFKNAYQHNSRTKTQFYAFLVVMFCSSINVHFSQSLS